MKRSSNLVGMSNTNNQGLVMKIIEYINYDNIIVEFEIDGFKKHTNLNSFKKGVVRHDKYKKAYKSLSDQRTGRIIKNKVGETMKVIQYNNAQHIVVEFQDEYRSCVNTSWDRFIKGAVRNPHERDNNIIRHSNNFVDIAGNIYGNLKVLYWDTNPPAEEMSYVEATGKWRCKCLLCGDINTWATKHELESGTHKYCKECGKKARTKRKYDIVYDLSGEYGIGYTYNTNKPFFFDLEDFELIKDYSWKENNSGYASAVKNGKYILMHRLVTSAQENDVVDHRCHNNLDNRKEFLRVSTCKNNLRNRKISKSNISGVTGVCWDNNAGLWQSYIWVDGKTIHLGRYSDINVAIKVRKEAENKYFGEWSYDNSMKVLEET